MTNHPFVAQILHPELCVICDKSHALKPECEACSNRDDLTKYMGMMLCTACLTTEKALQAANNSPEKQQERVIQARENERIQQITQSSQPVLSLEGVIDRARAIDQTIQVKSDVYNAQTIDNKTIKDGVWADDSIPAEQKYFRYATILRERQEHFQKLIDESQTIIVDNQNKQRVIQQELNLLQNQLRQEQRDKLHLNNPTYDPAKVKNVREAISKPKSLGTQKQKFDKKELIAIAADMQAQGFPIQWSTIQTVATQKNMTPKQAAEHIKKSLSN